MGEAMKIEGIVETVIPSQDTFIFRPDGVQNPYVLILNLSAWRLEKGK